MTWWPEAASLRHRHRPRANAWQYPALVGWNGYPAGLRHTLSAYDFGSADFGLTDADFAAHLTKAKPTGIPFDPNA